MRKSDLIKAVNDLVDFIQENLNEINVEILNTSPDYAVKYEELKAQRAIYNNVMQRMYDNGLVFADGDIKKEYV